MRSQQLIILFVVIDDIGDGLLLNEASLIDRVLRKVRFDDVQFA